MQNLYKSLVIAIVTFAAEGKYFDRYKVNTIRRWQKRIASCPKPLTTIETTPLQTPSPPPSTTPSPTITFTSETTTAEPTTSISTTVNPTTSTARPTAPSTTLAPTLAPTTTEEPFVCPSGWLQNSDHCFYFSDIEKSWSDAKEYCEGLSSILAEPKTESNIEFVRTTAQNKTYVYWLGATDQVEESVWIWASTNSSLTLTDWHDKEPNNHGGNEHCMNVHKNLNFEWNDSPCNIKFRFICEMK